MIKNLNELAVAVTLAEGGKVQVSIAQVKEILRVVRQLMTEYQDVAALVNKPYKPARKKK